MYGYIILIIQFNINKQFYLTHKWVLKRVNLRVIDMKVVLHIPQSTRTGASLSDGLVSYRGYLLGGGLTPLQWCS